jgi:CBS domain-containing protein
MRVHEIMTSPARTIAPDAAADAAWGEMQQEHIHHLVVMDGHTVVGVISERDLGGGHGEVVRADRRVRDLMSDDPVTIDADETVRRAANVLRGNQIGCLPVVDDGGKVVGVLTATDFLDMIGRGMEEPPHESTRQSMRDKRMPNNLGNRR